jgi:hypothetical protein
MITTERVVAGLYVDKACANHWIVQDRNGRFWMVQPGENCWERRQHFEPTDETRLEPVPGHYRYVLGLPD